jgi:hypothetical protein
MTPVGRNIPLAANFLIGSPIVNFFFRESLGPSPSSLIACGHRYQLRLRYHLPTPQLKTIKTFKVLHQETGSMNNGGEG